LFSTDEASYKLAQWAILFAMTPLYGGNFAKMLFSNLIQRCYFSTSEKPAKPFFDASTCLFQTPKQLRCVKALKTLNILQELAHRDLAERKKGVRSEYRDNRPNVARLRG